MTALIGTAPEEALIVSLETIIGDYKVAWPNVKFDPEAETPYYRASFLPVPPQRLGHGNCDKFINIFQVDVVVPAKDGALRAIALARAVATHFDRLTLTDDNGTKLRVIRPPAIAPHGQEVDWYYVPVSVTYEIIN